MSQQGIRITDRFATLCLGVFFGCVGMIFLSLFVSFDPNAMESRTLSDYAELAIAMAIPIGLLDVGFYQVIKGMFTRRSTPVNQYGNNVNTVDPLGLKADGGVTEEQQKAIRAVAGGISAVNVWMQRLMGIFVVLIGLAVTATFWFQPIQDQLVGKGSFKWGFLLMLGLILASFIVVIIYFLLMKKLGANLN